MHDAVALLEIRSIATGLATVDALSKRAAPELWAVGVVEPGRYIILFTGELAEVEEAWEAARQRAGSAWFDGVLLAYAHRDLAPALRGELRLPSDPPCVGVVEGSSLAGLLEAADRCLKDAQVGLAALRLQPGLGGKAYAVVVGAQHDVEAALEVARARLGRRLQHWECIPRPSPQLLRALAIGGTFQVGEG